MHNYLDVSDRKGIYTNNLDEEVIVTIRSNTECKRNIAATQRDNGYNCITNSICRNKRTPSVRATVTYASLIVTNTVVSPFQIPVL